MPETVSMNYINIFEQTHAFVSGHFICHYTFNYYFLLIIEKTLYYELLRKYYFEKKKFLHSALFEWNTVL